MGDMVCLMTNDKECDLNEWHIHRAAADGAPLL